MVENRKLAEWPSNAWQIALKEAITDPKELLSLAGVGSFYTNESQAALNSFAQRVPHSFIKRMKNGDYNDPLLKQVLPVAQETIFNVNYSSDPLAEKQVNPLPGLIHKYRGRVLLTATGACGVNCRYCFRREFPYSENNPGNKGWGKALEYIRNDGSIHEVILSGGDPLLLPDNSLIDLGNQLANISHVKTLRIHTRMPIVIPQRITNELLEWLAKNRFNNVMVFHCNHAQEIDADVEKAAKLLRSVNVILLNQSVLLKGVNNTSLVLQNLCERLLDIGVLPYYLHMLDKIQGAAHFEVPLEEARCLARELAEHLPGYLVPRLVEEIPGNKSKSVICLCESHRNPNNYKYADT